MVDKCLSLREDASAQSTYLQQILEACRRTHSFLCLGHLSPELMLYEESKILGLTVFTVPDASQMASVIRR